MCVGYCQYELKCIQISIYMYEPSKCSHIAQTFQTFCMYSMLYVQYVLVKCINIKFSRDQIQENNDMFQIQRTCSTKNSCVNQLPVVMDYNRCICIYITCNIPYVIMCYRLPSSGMTMSEQASHLYIV